jgi:hypothetical protein
MAGKSITASVGQGGVNLAMDVVTVQFLLNCVPEIDGGPVPELVIDGLIGPLTIAAIHRFQRTRFGWSDGRVDPERAGGVTIIALNEFDPIPDLPIPAPPQRQHIPPAAKRRGKGFGKKASGGIGPLGTIPPLGKPKGKGKGRGKKVSRQ